MSDGVGHLGHAPESSTAALRRANVAAVARLLFLDGPLTRADLLERTGLARPTVQAVVAELLADGTVREHPLRDGGGPGRPAVALRFDDRQASVVAGRRRDDRVDLVLTDLRGDVLATTDVTPTPPLPDLGAAVARAIARLRDGVPGAGPVGAVALCVPGVIDRSAGPATLTDPAHGWRDEPVVEWVAAETGVPTQILTPAAAALEGIGWQHRRLTRAAAGGPQDEAHSALLVFLDQGIAASACVGQQPVFGSAGDGGEIGHHVVVPDGEPCRCGRRGCLETLAAGWAVLRAVGRLRPSVPVDDGTTLAALEALGRADVDAVLAAAATALGEHVGMLVTALEPRWVLLGGTGFATGATRFLAAFREAVEARRARVADHETGYALAPADVDLVGATRAALDALPPRLRAAVAS